MPPDSKGSGASPAEPDQPTQAPPRPATKGSSAVTRPPGLRCQRVLPSGSVTWSTGNRLATTTTGLSARTSSAPSPIPPQTLLTSEPERDTRPGTRAPQLHDEPAQPTTSTVSVPPGPPEAPSRPVIDGG